MSEVVGSKSGSNQSLVPNRHSLLKMGYWGVKSYEHDEATDALDAGFDRVHGARYEELMDDRNPLSFEQVQQKLANPQTLDASIDAMRELLGIEGPVETWDATCAVGTGWDRRAACRGRRANSRTVALPRH